MPLPTFFLVGAPKAGTSSLFANLSVHPEVFVSPVKEPHYFTAISDGWPEWGVQTLDAYTTLFEGGEAYSVRGEGSTWYLYSPSAAIAIHDAVPNAKIVISLRNPIERAYSAWAYNLSNGWETESVFEVALAKEDERVQAPGFWDRHYVRAGLYAEQVQRYLDTFGESRVHVVLFEDFVVDADSAMRSLYKFLEIDPNISLHKADRVRNPTVFPKHPRLRRLMKHRRFKRALKKMLPARALTNAKKAVERVNTIERPAIKPATQSDLAHRFRDDVRRLEEVIGRDLERLWLGGSL